MIEFYGIKGPYGFLSNFYNAVFEVEAQRWSSVEHYYQASKATTLEDRKIIASSLTPGVAKNLGRTIVCRADWETPVGTPEMHVIFRDEQGVVVERVKDHYMFSALMAKFTQRRELREALLRTGGEPLAEVSPTDYYWGLGKDRSGLNKLGRMLQLVRARMLNRMALDGSSVTS